MGQAKQRQQYGFSDDLVREWEKSDCVDFAVALSRITGWLLHVDWLADTNRSTKVNSIEESGMIPLRVYVGDDNDLIYDPRGVRNIKVFSDTILKRLSKDRLPSAFRYAGVASRAYSEEKLKNLPLRHSFDEDTVEAIIPIIEANKAFLGQIKKRSEPTYPAYSAFTFSTGSCAIFAQALEEKTGIPAVGLSIESFLWEWGSTDRDLGDYFHSLIVHEDGTGEDSWGRQPIEAIASRFGVASWSLDRDKHLQVVRNLKWNTPERFNDRLEDAKRLIEEYRG